MNRGSGHGGGRSHGVVKGLSPFSSIPTVESLNCLKQLEQEVDTEACAKFRVSPNVRVVGTIPDPELKDRWNYHQHPERLKLKAVPSCKDGHKNAQSEKKDKKNPLA